MARIIKKEAGAPYILKEGDPKGVCMCGLSNNQPFCDGSHRQANGEEDGKLYSYAGGERKEVTIQEK